jgi:hypothetical protein
LVGSSISAPIEKLGFLAPFEEDVMREIKNGLLSPDYGLDLLKRGKATVQGPMDVRKALINNTGAGLTGLLYNR